MADPDQKAVVDAIIDEQLDAAELSKRAYEAGIEVSDTIITAARKIHAHVLAGKISAAEGKKLMRDVMVGHVLIEFAKVAGEIQDNTDKHMEAQAKAIDAYGKPLNTIPAIRDPDIQARAAEKAGLHGGE